MTVALLAAALILLAVLPAWLFTVVFPWIDRRYPANR